MSSPTSPDDKEKTSSSSHNASVHHVTSTLAKNQYLVATRQAWGQNALSPAAMIDVVESALHEDTEIELLRTLRARGVPGTSPVTTSGNPSSQAGQQHYANATRVLVARMSEEKAALLSATGIERGILVERDQRLSLAHPGVPEAADLGLLDVAAIAPLGKPLNVEVQVIGQNDAPLEGAQVVFYGGGLPAEAITDARGRARITLSGNALATLRALYVKPVADHWDTYVQQPNIQHDKVNVIQLSALGTQTPAWGLKAMRLDSLPADYTGRGAKVAIVDSGIATTHPALTRVNSGIDIGNPTTADGWRNDSISHGTHCAGIIGGAQQANVSVHGIAPEAELLGVKVFPGGHFSDLIDALDYAISQQVDVVNLSLGSEQGSEIVEQKLAEARAQGVACIVAAGNTGGSVQYPARSPHVFAVSALGKLDEFPASSYHAHTVLGDRQQVGEDGYFAAKFSSYGEQIDVSGPGVAIISATSPNNYAVLDGTSIAASHISGLAALIIAHHPDFKDRYRARNAQRVDRLFEILRQSARPVNVGDPRRVGAGLPDAFRALGLEVTGTKEVRENIAAGYQVLREQLKAVGILNDGREATPAASPNGSTSVRPPASGAGRASQAPAQRNGTPARTQSNQDQSSARIVTSLLLAELRKHLEDAQLIPVEEAGRSLRRAVGEAE